jgi:predicted MFS family arabinose efflux permease
MRMLFSGRPSASLFPVLTVTLISTAVMSGLLAYLGVWAVKGLGASSTAVGFMYLSYAVCTSLAELLGGSLSDRIGRRRTMVLSWLTQAVFAVLLTVVGHSVFFGILIVIFAVVAGSPAAAASSAAVADATTESDRETGYAQSRIMFNLGGVVGPPLAGLLLLSHHWAPLFASVSLFSLAAALVARFKIPEHTRSPRQHRHRAQLSFLRDRRFGLLLLSNGLGFFVYETFAVVLPVVAVTSFKLSPSLWGLIVAINPITVVLLQSRMTQATRHLSIAVKLGVASIFMGMPFLLLLIFRNIIGIIAVVVLLVIGEMLWAPTSQALAANLAEPGQVGAYMGAFRGTGQASLGLAPLIVLHLYNIGPSVTWFSVAGLALLGGLAGVFAGSVRPAGSAVTENAEQ